MKTYPFKRLPVDAIEWGSWTIHEGDQPFDPREHNASHDATYRWVIKATVTKNFPWHEYDGGFDVVVSAYVASNQFREQSVIHISPGQDQFACVVDLPGQRLFGPVTVEAVVVADIRDTQNRVVFPSARLASSPTSSESFSAEDVGLRTTVCSFAQEGWPAIPWKISLAHSLVDEDFASYVTVYVNSQSRVATALESKKANFELWQLSVDIMLSAVRHTHALLEAEYGRSYADDPGFDDLMLSMVDSAPTSLAGAVVGYARRAHVQPSELLKMAGNVHESATLTDTLKSAAGDFYAI